MEKRAAAMTGITWKAAVRRVLQGNKILHLKDINDALEPYAKTRDNQHWQAKVRQVLQDECGFHADSDTHSTRIRTVIPR